MKFFPTTSLAMYLLLFLPFTVILGHLAIASPISISHLFMLVLLGIFAAAFWWLVPRKTIHLSPDVLRQGRKMVPLKQVRGVSYDVMVSIFTARGRTRLVFALPNDTSISINIAGFSQGQINKLLNKLVDDHPSLRASIGQASKKTEIHHKIAKYIGLALLAACVGYFIWAMLVV